MEIVLTMFKLGQMDTALVELCGTILEKTGSANDPQGLQEYADLLVDAGYIKIRVAIDQVLKPRGSL